MLTLSPALNFCPRSSVSRVTLRRKYITGDAQRRISSVADGTSAGLSASISNCSGCSISACIPCDIALRVVSLPATASSRKNTLKSISESLSPSISALSSAVTMSSRGSLAPLFRELVRVHEHLDRRLLDLLLADRVLGILAADHPVAPLEELVPIFERHAEHLGDHLQRQLGGDVDDEVAIALFERRVEDLRHHLADVRAERVDHARRESAVDQRAVARVIGRVHREHHAALRGQVGRGLGVLERDHAAARLLGGIGDAVAADFDHVVVARDHPEAGPAGLGMLVEGALWRRSEPFVRNFVLENERVEQIDLASVHGDSSRSRK